MKRSDFIKTTAAGLIGSLFSTEMTLGNEYGTQNNNYNPPKTLVLDPERASYRTTSTTSPTSGRWNQMSSLYGAMRDCAKAMRFSFVGEGSIGDITYDKIKGFDIISIETNDNRIYSQSEVESVKNYIRNGGLILICDDDTRVHLGGYVEGQFMKEFGFVTKPQDGTYTKNQIGYNDLFFFKAPEGTNFNLNVRENKPEITSGTSTIKIIDAEPAEIINPRIARPVFTPMEDIRVVKQWTYMGRSPVSDDMPYLDFKPELPFIHFNLGLGQGIYVSRGIFCGPVYEKIGNWIKRQSIRRR
jgi:hypothetical protein